MDEAKGGREGVREGEWVDVVRRKQLVVYQSGVLCYHNHTQPPPQKTTTTGDLKLVEKPQGVVLAAGDFSNIKASVKVLSSNEISLI